MKFFLRKRRGIFFQKNLRRKTSRILVHAKFFGSRTRMSFSTKQFFGKQTARLVGGMKSTTQKLAAFFRGFHSAKKMDGFERKRTRFKNGSPRFLQMKNVVRLCFYFITLSPRPIAVSPVLAYSKIPYGSSRRMRLSIFSSLPVASTMTDSSPTSTMWAR